MRIAAVTDIHGNLPALEAVWAEIGRAKPDLVVNLGDIASGPLWPQETVQWLMAREAADPAYWRTIAGNHERQVLAPDIERMSAADAFAARALGAAERHWLASLPPALWLRRDILLCHGTPASDLTYFMETVMPGFERGRFDGVRAANAVELRERAAQVAPTRDGTRRDGLSAALILCGHTHMPRMMAIAGCPLVVNPGSVGMQGYDDIHPFPHVMETGNPLARWALVEQLEGEDGRTWHAHLCATPYDWKAASARALANGRPDWADVVATGFVSRYEGGGQVPT